MENILTYVRNNFDTFEERPFCTVDSLVLSWVVYTHFPENVLPENTWEECRFYDLLKAECFEEMFGSIWNSEGSRDLLFALAASPRFRNVRICGYVTQYDEASEKQFAAVTFRLEEKLSYIAFRGTDATVVGWKEDFNMAFQSPIPAQEEAVRYLNEAATHCPGELYVGGHSKGGNLAVYSSVKASPTVSARILTIYSHDGPGFLQEFLDSEAYQKMKGRIEKTVPQSSLVGILFENQEAYDIVKSHAFALWQHDPFSWEVEGTEFCKEERLTAGAKHMDITLNAWIAELSIAERERFVDTLFEILNSSDADTTEELFKHLQEDLPSVLLSLKNLDDDTKNFILKTIRALVTMGIKSLRKN